MSNVIPFPRPKRPELPQGPFSLAMIDPPWRFEVHSRENGLGKSPDKHYPTMKLPEIAALPVGEILAKNCVVGIWGYDPMLPALLTLGEAWDLKFVTVLFRWLKTDNKGRLCFGTGYHTRGGGCEEMWLFKRGKGLPVLRHDIRKEFYSKRREHSRKPDEVAGWMVDLYGDVPRVELFARTERPGWTVWGNEIDKFIPPTTPAAALAA